jgi:DnaJ domain
MKSAMNDELTDCYYLLGLSPGASPEELKAAHRDLAKVWHPDRFLHDPRLQAKAQEKLKEINEAYDQLRSGKSKRQSRPPASTTERHRQPTSQTANVAIVQRIRWKLILAPVLIFAVAFLAVSRSLLHPGGQENQSQVPAIEQPDAPPNREQQHPGNRAITPANDLQHSKDRLEAMSQKDESDSASTSQPSAAPLRPLPTVTMLIDPSTGMIARPDCPVKTRMTYPTGSEPNQLCNAVHPAAPTAPPAASGPKDSRLKSVAKRLATPDKWFNDKAKSDAENKEELKLP